MKRVFIVNMLCFDDREDNTQIVGVYTNKKAAYAHVDYLASEDLEANVEERDLEDEFAGAEDLA